MACSLLTRTTANKSVTNINAQSYKNIGKAPIGNDNVADNFAFNAIAGTLVASCA